MDIQETRIQELRAALAKTDEMIKTLEAHRKDLFKRLVDLLPEPAVTVAEMTPQTWREMSGEQRSDWAFYWSGKGWMWFACVHCGCPQSQLRGRLVCEACTPTNVEIDPAKG